MSPRHDLILRSLDELGCRGLLVVASSARDPDLAPFVGPVHVHRSFLVVPRNGDPTLAYFTPMERDEAAATGLPTLSPEELDISRWQRDGAPEEEILASALGQAFLRLGIGPGRLALAGHGPAGIVGAALEKLGDEGWSFVSGHGLVRRARKVKSKAELDAIRHAAEGTVRAIREVAKVLARGEIRDGRVHDGSSPLTVGSLRRVVSRVFADHGLSEPEGNIFGHGPKSAVPHTAGADEDPVHEGEALIVDLFPKGRLFADCTRTLCRGAPSEELRRAHEAVRAALDVAHRGARPGVTGWSLQQAVCDELGERGYPTPISDPGTVSGYVHNLGHGVGYELHELPSFRDEDGKDTGVLAIGDAITLEPGIYDPEAGYGVRLEDLVVLGEEGPENLTPLPYELDPAAWDREEK